MQKNSTTPLTIRRLVPADVMPYQKLRIQGLKAHPEAFSASYEDEVEQPLSWFEDRLQNSIIFGGFDREGMLLGIAALIIPSAQKLRHKGTLSAIYILPQARGTGLSKKLIGQLISSHAEGVLEEVLLTVGAFNDPAIRLYKGLGFKETGFEKRALKVGDTYYDELQMALTLNS